MRIVVMTVALMIGSSAHAQLQVGPPLIYQTPAPSVTSTAPSPDTFGFTAWLNGVRSQRGLRAVACDAALCGWANANNAQQQVRGIGHYVMGPARRQNSGMGSYSAVVGMWLKSPLHLAALLDPSITRIGIANCGSYWTYNAN